MDLNLPNFDSVKTGEKIENDRLRGYTSDFPSKSLALTLSGLRKLWPGDRSSYLLMCLLGYL